MAITVTRNGETIRYTVVREGNGTYELTQRRGWDEPRVYDLDLARWLGFTDPHKVRALIRRNIDAGHLPGVSATVAETSPRGGRPGAEYFLTEAEALFIATRSETPKSIAVTKTMIAVFVDVRNADAPPAELPTPRPQIGRPAMVLALTELLGGMVAEGDWPAVEACGQTIAGLARNLPGPAAGASQSVPYLAIGAISNQINALLKADDFYGVQLAGEHCSALARPFVSVRRGRPPARNVSPDALRQRRHRAKTGSR